MLWNIVPSKNIYLDFPVYKLKVKIFLKEEDYLYLRHMNDNLKIYNANLT